MIIGRMTEVEIAEVLRQQTFGYLSLTQSDGTPFATTVYYAVEWDGNIIAHTVDQKLVAMLRANPTVCFLVHQFSDSYHWRQVRVIGQCIEVADELAKERLLANLFRAIPALTPEETKMSKGLSETVAYKIIVTSTESEKEEW